MNNSRQQKKRDKGIMAKVITIRLPSFWEENTHKKQKLKYQNPLINNTQETNIKI